MNFENIFYNLQTQGPTFWAAALAITLGATLLLVSLIAQFRLMMGSFRGWSNPFKNRGLKPLPKPTESGISSKPGVAIDKTDAGYQPSSMSPLNPGPSQNTGSYGDTDELTARLHHAANTLEEIRQSLRQDNFTPGFSVLKHEAEGVEYLFKTTAV